ncbi:MAG: ribonuclease Z [Flavobacteriaceae bacterium]
MIFDKEGNITTVLQENIALRKFIENLSRAYPRIKNDHIIVNLFSFSRLSTNNLLEFLNLSNSHRAANKSFVLVNDKVNFEEVPDELCVVPTIQEAKDIIEMEEIERDLGI